VSTQASLDNVKEHAPHFEQQHRSTCHSGHFHRARWMIPSTEFVLTNKICQRGLSKQKSGHDPFLM